MSVTVPRKTAVEMSLSACTSSRGDPGTVRQVQAVTVSTEAALAIANAKTYAIVLFIAYSITGSWTRMQAAVAWSPELSARTPRINR